MTAEQLEELPADVAEVIRRLTRRVIEAEKLVEALARLGTPACFGSGEALGVYLPDSPLGREILSRMEFAQATLTAYREASK